MKKNEIYNIIYQQIIYIMPELNQKPITPNHSLKGLGANSIDRAEIIMLSMSKLNVKIPLVQFAQAENIQDIVDIFQQHIQECM